MVQIEEDVREKVKSLLRELFKFDNQDLDFGIYRIMNFKRKEIEKFIEQDLIAEAERQFQEYSHAGQADLKIEVDRLKVEIVRDFGEGTLNNEGKVKKNEDAPKVKLYLDKKKQLEEDKVTQSQISDVFNHLYEFFSRYYDKGDFIPKRRYGGKSKYYIPYNGEEVALYWATKDMYYIKTGEFFKKYSFRTGRYLVTFVLTEAKVEVGNIKGERKYFMLSPEKPVTIDDTSGLVEILFNYRGVSEEESAKLGKSDVQATLVNEAIATIASMLKDNAFAGILKPRGEGEKPLLEKHLNNYVKRNTQDFFIHKNLKGFLETELDFYLKNEVWTIGDLEASDGKDAKILAAKAKAIHNIATKIIEFLNQIEDFQKKLWNKRKLIFGTGYIITLDKIKKYTNEEFFENIVELILRNSKQTEEWEQILGIKVTTRKDIINKQTFDGVEWKKLPIDTKYFDADFEISLLGALSEKNNLDDIVDGILIRSENFHALKLILRTYHERVKVIYIDPPYNTGSDEFLYKDNYQHSSWLSMMNDRLGMTKELMTDNAVLFTHIDENEQFRLRLLLEGIFSPTNYIAPFVWLSRAGKGGTVANIQVGHEYVECAVKDKDQSNFKPTVKEVETGNYSDKKGMYRRELLRQWGSQAQRREDRPSMYFPIPTPFGGEVYPKLPDGSDGRWRFGIKTVTKMLSDDDLDFIRDEKTGESVVYRKIRLGGKTTSAPSNILDDVGSSADGTKEIQALFNEKVFDTCKPLKLAKKLIDLVTWEDDSPVFILDFFAGSGTTANAVMELNKDGKHRKFILVEMADHFDTVVVPRIKKIAYSFEWKEGKPKEGSGLGILCKYHYVEQYEDTLNNIAFSEKDKTIQEKLDGFGDYFLRYMLDYETKESTTRLIADKFMKPFNYKIRIINAEEKTVTVDLVETFNYLLGLKVEKFQRFIDNERIYRVVFGKLETQSVCVIWRDLEQIDLEKDKQFIESKILVDKTFDFIYVNGDSYVKKAKPIEPKFKRLMGA